MDNKNPRTLYQKIWDDHVVEQDDFGNCLLYIDRQLIHEVTSPQAFESLRIRNILPWRTSTHFAVPDHNIPTTELEKGIQDPLSKIQVETLEKNCQHFGIKNIPMYDKRQGIVHVIGPEQGLILPGTTIVCGDSHTSTHGAFAALALGIGTSQVEHVLATQCLSFKKTKTMRITFEGEPQPYVTSKDYALYMIGKIGTAGGNGCTIEYQGNAIQALSMEARMTLCNMSIEAGSRAGLIAYDDTTAQYLNKHSNLESHALAAAKKYWQTMQSDPNAVFDKTVNLNANDILPQVTWGTSPEMVTNVFGKTPNLNDAKNATQAKDFQKAMTYMGVAPNQAIEDIKIDSVFIGSCTNSRIEDLRLAASIVHGKKIKEHLQQAMIVPGSGLVRQQAEKEGLDRIFKEAGFQWRHPGCSMCLAMNADRLKHGERCASTSNRNFEGRQGAGGRTHLVNPAMAAAAAIAGHFIHPENL